MFDSFKSKTGVKELFLTDGRPPYKQALPLALQHVVAMIVGCVTPAIIVAGIALSRGEISPEDKIVLVQGALIVAAVATLLQLISLKNKVGSGLPVIMGVSFAYLATMQAVVQEFDLATLFGAQLTGGIVAVIVGIFIKRIRSLFPPIVTGTVVFTIGLSLYPVAVGYMAGGTGSKDYGSVKNWAVALITLAVVVGLSHFTKGFLKLSAILIGICVGYVIAVILGMVDFSPVLSASWVQLPRPLHFGIKFEPSSMITMSILFVVNSVQAIGDLTATTQGGLGREPSDRELSGGIIGNGLGSLFGAVFGGLPTATFSQNVGIVGTTKVVAKRVFYLASAIILAAGLLPKIASLLTTIPQCVLGGATISVFASIAMTGVKLIAKAGLNNRNTAIVGLGVAVGMGITLAPDSLALFPSWVMMVFGKSAVVLATLITVVLNLIIPKEEEKVRVRRRIPLKFTVKEKNFKNLKSL